MNYVSPKEAKKYYRVTDDTLRRWAKNGQIKFITTNGGHRRYALPEEKEDKQKIIYARVSSKKQEQDLKRQVAFLKEKYPKHTVITDIASGINFKRQGFKTILEQVFKNDVKEVVVFSSDRIARFGFDLIETIFSYFNTKLIIENNSEKIKSPQEELADDLLSIVTIFTAKYHGSRKYKLDKDK